MLEQKELKNLFDWAKTDYGWPMVLNMLKNYPGLAKNNAGPGGSSLLHWAALGNMNAMLDLITKYNVDINVLDASDRTPLEWAIEKLYFMREEAYENTSKQTGNWRQGEMLAEMCAIQLIKLGAKMITKNEIKGSYSIKHLALKAGSLPIALEFNWTRASDVFYEYTFCGFWPSKNDFKLFLEKLKKDNPEEEARDLALQIAGRLRSENQISDDRLKLIESIFNDKENSGIIV